MKLLILGGDGYLGWPTAMSFAAKGHDVYVVDNYSRRRIAQETSSEALFTTPNLNDRAEIFESITGYKIGVSIFDCKDYRVLDNLMKDFMPDAVIHYAEQPSAPYSMLGYTQASYTLQNNLLTTFNVIWSILENKPDCHLVKLGTMGEYGTPNIDIEEGWLKINHNGKSDTFLFPRQAGSLYHTTKILDTDLLWFYVRHYGLMVTDLMQGPVYGLTTSESGLDEQLLPNFHYDDIFGTVLNRFLVQAVAGVPLTVYGKGGQKRGFLNLIDTLQCVELALLNPVQIGELRILNQFTQTFSVNELAEHVQSAGKQMRLDVKIQSISNPRKEAESHYYSAKHSELIDLGLEPHLLTEDVLCTMLEKIIHVRDKIDTRKIHPRVFWPD